MKFHYVYRITNTETSTHYYGVRTSSVPPSEDLGVTYFSSSSDKEFIKNQNSNRSHYRYKVVRTFRTREAAVDLEIKLHQKFNVAKNPKFYNRASQTSKGFDTTGFKFHGKPSSNKGKRMSDEQKKKISNTLKGKTHSQQRKENISKALKGKIPWNKGKLMPEEFKKACSRRRPAMLGKSHSTNTKSKMSEAAKNLPVVTCPYCKKQGKGNGMRRWHFDNCKTKES